MWIIEECLYACCEENVMPRNLDKYKKEFEKNRKELLKMSAYVWGGLIILILLFWIF